MYKVELTTEDKNSNKSHQLFLEKLVLLRKEISYENNRKKNSEQTNLDRNFSSSNQEASAFFSGDDGEEIIDAGGKVGGGFSNEWGGKDGPKYGGYLEGEYENDHGGRVRGKIEGDSDGNGRFEIDGGMGSQYD